MENDGAYLLVDPAFSLEAFHGIASSMMMRPLGPGSGARGVDYSERWSDGETILEWIEVGRLDARFIWFRSPDPSTTAAYLASYLRTKDVTELIRLASEAEVAHDSLIDLLYRIAYMAPAAGPEIVQLYQRRLSDPRPTIRRAALNGFRIRRWPQLRAPVEGMAKADPDSEVRATAQKALSSDP